MKTHNALLFGREVRISRTLTGTAEQVWGYLTRPELLEKWFAVGEIGTVGSRVYMIQRSDAPPWKKSGYMCGIVMEREPMKRLSYTIKEVFDGLPEEEVEDSFVEFCLQESGAGVDLSIIHSRLGREELPWIYAEWNARLDLLQEDLAVPAESPARRMTGVPISHCLVN